MKVIYNNKKAYFNYFIEETFEAGIVLVGSEVKSARSDGLSLADSFVVVKDGQVFLKNAYIKQFDKTHSFVPNEKKDRKLLLNRREILKLERGIKEKKLAIVPTKAYFKDNLVKIEIALAKGKKLYDKKDTLKEKSQKREIDEAIKNIKRVKL